MFVMRKRFVVRASRINVAGSGVGTNTKPCGLTPVKIGVTTPVLRSTDPNSLPMSTNVMFGESPVAVIL